MTVRPSNIFRNIWRCPNRHPLLGERAGWGRATTPTSDPVWLTLIRFDAHKTSQTAQKKRENRKSRTTTTTSDEFESLIHTAVRLALVWLASTGFDRPWPSRRELACLFQPSASCPP